MKMNYIDPNISNINNFGSTMTGFNMDNVLNSVIDDIDDMLSASIPPLPPPKTSPSNSYCSSGAEYSSSNGYNHGNNSRPISPSSNNGDTYSNNNYFIPNNNPSVACSGSANSYSQLPQIPSHNISHSNNSCNTPNNKSGTYVYGGNNNFVYGNMNNNNNNTNSISYNKGKGYQMKRQQVNHQYMSNMKNRVQLNYNQERERKRNNNNNSIHTYQYNGDVMNDSPIYKPAKISLFEPGPEVKLQLKDYVFISKDCTNKLAQYLVKEEWGKSHALLYKYLDYIFRCQSFGKQSVVIQHCQTPKKFLLFNSGLQRRCDNKTLYALLIPNNIPNSQPWRVPFGPIENSFLSKDELFKKLQRCNMAITDQQQLPERTKFNTCLGDLLYDESYAITVCVYILYVVLRFFGLISCTNMVALTIFFAIFLVAEYQHFQHGSNNKFLQHFQLNHI